MFGIIFVSAVCFLRNFLELSYVIVHAVTLTFCFGFILSRVSNRKVIYIRLFNRFFLPGRLSGRLVGLNLLTLITLFVLSFRV